MVYKRNNTFISKLNIFTLKTILLQNKYIYIFPSNEVMIFFSLELKKDNLS